MGLPRAPDPKHFGVGVGAGAGVEASDLNANLVVLAHSLAPWLFGCPLFLSLTVVLGAPSQDQGPVGTGSICLREEQMVRTQVTQGHAHGAAVQPAVSGSATVTWEAGGQC